MIAPRSRICHLSATTSQIVGDPLLRTNVFFDMTVHGTRGALGPGAGLTSEYALDLCLQDTKSANDLVYHIVEDLVTGGAQILYMRYIESQRVPYASRTLARELVLNASWASIYLDNQEIVALPDADLTIPPIDEWAGGVLPVRNSDPTNLRTSVTPQREFRQTGPLRRTLQAQEETSDTRRGASERQNTLVPRVAPKSDHEKKPAKKVIVLTEGQIIAKAFDEARKKTNMAMKTLTVDSDFSVIQIQEPKGLPPALIVPKVTTKSQKLVAIRSTATLAIIPKGPRASMSTADLKKKKKPLTMLIQPDLPAFDEEVANLSYADRFVCAPGVTFRDGQTVKSRPPLSNAAQMSRSQYDSYLAEMKRSGE
jgi:hypothetical protein